MGFSCRHELGDDGPRTYGLGDSIYENIRRAALPIEVRIQDSLGILIRACIHERWSSKRFFRRIRGFLAFRDSTRFLGGNLLTICIF